MHVSRKDDDEYADHMKEGVRRALARKGVDVDVPAELGRASQEAGLNRRFFQQLLDGTVSSPRAVNMRKMCRYLDATEDELIAAAKRSWAPAPISASPQISPHVTDLQLVPEYDVRATTHQDAPAMLLIQERPRMGERSISADLLKRLHPNADAAIIRITGDAMEPDYPNGSCVLVDVDVRVPSPDGVYVLWDGFSHSIKRCQIIPGSSPAMVRLSASNPAYRPLDVPLSGLKVCGMVVAALDSDTWEENSA